MGVFDFVKDAGAKVGIGESTAEEEAKAAAEEAAKEKARSEQAKKVQERLAKNKQRAKEAAEKRTLNERIAESKKAQGLEDFIKKLGLDVEGLDVRFDDGVAEVEGKVADQATKEKIILAIGNTEGVEQVKEDIEVTAAEKEASDMHAVVSGDTLWGLAEKYYGDGKKYPTIFEANKPMLKDPNKIYVGQVLRIPAAS